MKTYATLEIIALALDIRVSQKDSCLSQASVFAVG
jgi:hypothetical protein